MTLLSYRGLSPLPADTEEPTFFPFPAPGEAREDRGEDSQGEPPAHPFHDDERLALITHGE